MASVVVVFENAIEAIFPASAIAFNVFRFAAILTAVSEMVCFATPVGFALYAVIACNTVAMVFPVYPNKYEKITLIYYRFHDDFTKEIRVLLLDGDDIAVIEGEENGTIKIIVDGGNGNNDVAHIVMKKIQIRF